MFRAKCEVEIASPIIHDYSCCIVSEEWNACERNPTHASLLRAWNTPCKQTNLQGRCKDHQREELLYLTNRYSNRMSMITLIYHIVLHKQYSSTTPHTGKAELSEIPTGGANNEAEEFWNHHLHNTDAVLVMWTTAYIICTDRWSISLYWSCHWIMPSR